jgi:hypothetical protein
MKLALLLVAVLARDELPTRPIRFEERPPFLTMSVAMPDLVDDALRARLRSGFVTTIVLRAYLYREDAVRPLGVFVRTYRVLYDLWDELYSLQIEDAQGVKGHQFHGEKEVLRAIVELERLPLVPLASVPVGLRHFVAVIVEVNPLSPELLAEARRWLARPSGGERFSGSEGFLGTFMSVFANKRVNEAERVLKFRSPPVVRTVAKP